MTKNRKLAYLAILVNVVIWGAALPVVKPALNLITPFQFLFLRYALASLILIPLLIISLKQTPLPRKTLVAILLIEFIQVALGHSLLYKGLDLTTSLEASLIGSITPVLVTLGGITFLKEKEENNEWLGLILSVIGSLIIIITPAFQTTPNFSYSLAGNSLVMGYNLSWVAYILLAKKHYRHTHKITVTALSSLVGLVFYLIWITITGDLSSTLPALTQSQVLLPALYMGILGTPVAVGLYLYGIKHIEASEAGLFAYLQPLIYLPLATLWLKEPLLPLQLIGLVLAVIGVFIAEFRPKKKTPRRKLKPAPATTFS